MFAVRRVGWRTLREGIHSFGKFEEEGLELTL